MGWRIFRAKGRLDTAIDSHAAHFDETCGTSTWCGTPSEAKRWSDPGAPGVFFIVTGNLRQLEASAAAFTRGKIEPAAS